MSNEIPKWNRIIILIYLYALLKANQVLLQIYIWERRKSYKNTNNGNSRSWEKKILHQFRKEINSKKRFSNERFFMFGTVVGDYINTMKTTHNALIPSKHFIKLQVYNKAIQLITSLCLHVYVSPVWKLGRNQNWKLSSLYWYIRGQLQYDRAS